MICPLKAALFFAAAALLNLSSAFSKGAKFSYWGLPLFIKLRSKLHSFVLNLIITASIAIVGATNAHADFLGLKFKRSHLAFTITIEDIRLEGLQHIEPSAVFAYLPIKPGDTFTDSQGPEIIRALFATGFFNNVHLSIQNKVVVIQVQERPAILSVDFSGIREFNKENLTKALRAVGLSAGRYYDKNLIDKAEQELKRQYLIRGHYAAEVTTTVTPLDQNRVALLFSVIEGPKAKIRQVNFIGNRAVKTSSLKGEMQLSTPNWVSWYTKSDLYSSEKLANDLETIRSYYLDRGYLEFNFESTQVLISPDKQNMYLTISLHEGKPYTVSDIQLTGDWLNRKEALQKLIALKPGERFSAAKLKASTKAIVDKLGEYGYAFATVDVRPIMDSAHHTVRLIMQGAPGHRVTVRRVNIMGNNRTRDEVVRREMRQFESAWFDSQRLKRSQERINHLDYFTEVNVTTAPVAGTTDQVDVDVKVMEKPTGSLLFGLGYSSSDKLVLNAGISKDNVFGSGTSLSVQLNTAKVYRTLSVTQIDPYFTIDGIKRITDVYYRTYQPLLYSTSSNFTIVTAGTDLKFGVPFSEVDTVYFGVGFEQNRLKTDALTPQVYRDFISEFGRIVNNVPITVGWSRDYRDSALVPNRGYFTQANAELGTPIGGMQYYKLDFQQQYYYSFARGFVLGLNGQIGYGKGLANHSFPIFKNYFAGGIGSVRGYAPSSLGPKDPDTGDPIGGSKLLIGNIELAFPLPHTGYERTLRLFTFMDAGNVWGQNERVSLHDLRYGYGIGLEWISPIIPIKLSLGFPLVKKEGDIYQKFQFQVSTAF